MMRNSINHITKLEFLPAFNKAYHDSFTQKNICAGFRGAGLIPFDPDSVLAKLDIKLRTPSPLPAAASQWESKTPSNAAELGSQTALIRDRIQRHQDSSPTSIIESLNRLSKGAELMMHSSVLVQAEIANLRKANEAATRRRKRQKKRIQQRGSLTKAEGSEIIAQNNVDEQIEGESRQSRQRARGNAPQQRRCRRCGEPGHNSRTCEKEEEDSSNSATSDSS